MLQSKILKSLGHIQHVYVHFDLKSWSSSSCTELLAVGLCYGMTDLSC